MPRRHARSSPSASGLSSSGRESCPRAAQPWRLPPVLDGHSGRAVELQPSQAGPSQQQGGQVDRSESSAFVGSVADESERWQIVTMTRTAAPFGAQTAAPELDPRHPIPPAVSQA